MRRTGVLPALAWLALGAAPAAAASFTQPYRVQEWSIANGAVFSDDFADGVFDAASYTVACGGIPGETGGALVLDDGAPGCPGLPGSSQVVEAASLTFGAGTTVTAVFDWTFPAANELYGVRIGDRVVSVRMDVFAGQLEALLSAADFSAPPMQIIPLIAPITDTAALQVIFPNAIDIPTSSLGIQIELVASMGLIDAVVSTSVDGGAFDPAFTVVGALDPADGPFSAALLASAVPEPALGWLLAPALGATALRRRP